MADVGSGGAQSTGHLRCSTQEIHGGPLATIERRIVIRDSKERFLSAAPVLFVVGSSLYLLRRRTAPADGLKARFRS